MEGPHLPLVVNILIIMALTTCDAANSSRPLTSHDIKRLISDLKVMSGAPPFKHFVSGSVNETQSRRILTLVYESSPKKRCHLKVNEFLDPDTKHILKSKSKVRCRTKIVHGTSEVPLEMEPFNTEYVLKMLRVRLKRNKRIKNVLNSNKTVFPTKSVIVVTFVTVADKICTVTFTRLNTHAEKRKTKCRWNQNEHNSEHRLYIYKLIQRLKRKLTRALEVTTNSHVVLTFKRLNLIIQKLELAVEGHQNLTRNFSQSIKKIFLEIQKLPKVDKSILQLIKLILKILDNPEEIEDREKINQELTELTSVLTKWVTKSNTTIKPDVRKLLMTLHRLNEYYKEHATYPINFSVFVKFLMSVLREISDVSGSIQSLVQEIQKLSEKFNLQTSTSSETERFEVGIKKLKEQTHKELAIGGDQKNHNRIIKLLDAILNEYVKDGRILPVTELDPKLKSDTSYTLIVEKLEELLRRQAPSGVRIGLQQSKLKEYLIVLENWWKKEGTEKGLSREKIKEIQPVLRGLLESYNKLKTFPQKEVNTLIELLKELESLKDTNSYTRYLIKQIINTLTHSSDNRENSRIELPKLLEALEEWVHSQDDGTRPEIKEILEILHPLNNYTKRYNTFPKNYIPAIKKILSKVESIPEKMDIYTPVLIEQIQKGLPNELQQYLVSLNDWWKKSGTEKGPARQKIKEIQPLLRGLIESYNKLKTFPQEDINTLIELLKELENLKETNQYTRHIIIQITNSLTNSSDNHEDELPTLLETLEQWVDSLGNGSRPEIKEILEILHPLNTYTKRYNTFPKNYIPAIKKILSKVESIPDKMDISTPVLIEQIQKGLPNELQQYLVSLNDWWKKSEMEKGPAREKIKEIQPLLRGLIESYNKLKTFPQEDVNTLIELLKELQNLKDTNLYTRHIIIQIINPHTHASDNHEDSHNELPRLMEALEQWVNSLGKGSRPEIKEILEILHPLNTYTKRYNTFPKNYIPVIKKILSKVESIPDKMDISTPVLIEQIQKGLPNELQQYLVSLNDWWKKRGTEKGPAREKIKEIQPLLRGLIESYNKLKTFPQEDVNTLIELLKELENLKDTNQYTRHIIIQITNTLTHSSDNHEDELPTLLETLEQWVDSLGNGSRPEIKEILEILHPLNTYTKRYNTFPKNYVPAIKKILSKVESIPENMDISTPVLIEQIQKGLPNELQQYLVSLNDWWKKRGTEKGPAREKIKEIQPLLRGLIESYNKLKTFPQEDVNTLIELLKELENLTDTNQYTRHIIIQITNTLTHSSDNHEDELPTLLETLEQWVDSLGNGSRPEIKEILEILHPLNTYTKRYNTFPKNYVPAIKKILSKVESIPENMDISTPVLIEQIQKGLPNELQQYLVSLNDWWKKSGTEKGPAREKIKEIQPLLRGLIESYNKLKTFPQEDVNTLTELLKELQNLKDTNLYTRHIIIQIINPLTHSSDNHEDSHNELPKLMEALEQWVNSLGKGSRPEIKEILEILHPLNTYTKRYNTFPKNYIPAIKKILSKVESIPEKMDIYTPVLIEQIQKGLPNELQQYLVSLDDWWKKSGTEKGPAREKIKEIQPLLRGLIESYNKLKTFPQEDVNTLIELLKELENLKDTNQYTRHIIIQITNTLTHSSDNHEDELPTLLETLEQWVDSLGNGSRPEIKEILEILHPLNTYTKRYNTFPKNYVPAIKKILSKVESIPENMDISTPVLIEQIQKGLPNELQQYLVSLKDWWKKSRTEKGPAREKIKEIQPLLHGLIESYNKLKTFPQEDVNTLIELLKELENLKDTNLYTRHIIIQIINTLTHSSDNHEDSHNELPKLMEALEQWVNSLGKGSRPEIKEILEILHPLNTYTKRYNTFPKNYIPVIKKILSKVESIPDKMDISTPVLIEQIQKGLPNELQQYLVSLNDWWKKSGTEKGPAREKIKEIQPLLHGLIESYNKLKTFPQEDVNTLIELLKELENLKDTNLYTRHIIIQIINTLTHSSDNHEDSHNELPKLMEALEQWVNSLGKGSRPEIKEILEILHPLNTYTKRYNTFPKNYIPVIKKILSKVESIPDKMDISTPVLIEQIQKGLPNELQQYLVSLNDWWKKRGTEKGPAREKIKEIQPLLRGLIESYNKLKTFPQEDVNTLIELLKELENLKDTNQYTRHIIIQITNTLTHSSDNHEDELPTLLETLEQWVDSLGNGSRPEIKEILEILHPLNTYTKRYNTFPKNYVPAIKKILSKVESIPENMDISTPVLIEQIQKGLPNELQQYLVSLNDWWKKRGTEKGPAREKIKEIQPLLRGLIESYNKLKTFPQEDVNTLIELLKELENLTDTNQYTRHIIIQITNTLTHSSDNHEDELPTLLETLEQWVDSLGNGSRPEIKEILEILHPLNTYTKRYNTFPKNYVPAIKKILSKVESIPENMDISTPVLIEQIQKGLPNELQQYLVSLNDWWKKSGTEKGPAREKIKEIQPLLRGLIESYNKLKTFPQEDVNTLTELLKELQNLKDTNLYTRHIIIQIINPLTHSSDNHEDSHNELPKLMEALEQWVNSLGKGSRPEIKEILEILHPLNTYTKRYNTFPKNYIPAIKKILSKVESIPEKMDIYTPVLIEQIQKGLPNELQQYLVSLDDWWKKSGTEKGPAREKIKEIQPLLRGLIESYNKLKTFPQEDVNTLIELLKELENLKDTNQYTRHIIIQITNTLTHSSDNHEDELPTLLETLEQWVDSLGNGSRPEIKEILEILHPLNTYTKRYNTFPKNYVPAIKKILSKVESIPENMDISTPVLIEQIQKGLPNELQQYLVSLKDWWKKSRTEKGPAREKIKEIQPLLHGLIESYNKLKTFPQEDVNTLIELLKELENLKDTNLYTRHIIIQIINTLTHSSDNHEDSHNELPKLMEALEQWVNSLGKGSRPEIKEILEILHPLNTYTKRYNTFPKNYIPVIKKILSKVESIPDKMDISTPVLIEQIQKGLPNELQQYLVSLNDWWKKSGTEKGPAREKIKEIQPLLHGLIESYNKLKTFPQEDVNTLIELLKELENLKDTNLYTRHIIIQIINTLTHSSDNHEDSHNELPKLMEALEQWVNSLGKGSRPEIKEILEILHPLNTYTKRYNTFPKNYIPVIKKILSKVESIPDKMDISTPVLIEQIQKGLPNELQQYLVSLDDWWKKSGTEKGPAREKIKEIQPLLRGLIESYNKLKTFPQEDINTLIELLKELENLKDTNQYTRHIIIQITNTLTHSSDNHEDELPTLLETLEQWVDSLGNGSRPEIKEILEILHPLNTYTKRYNTFPKNYIPAITKILSKVESIPEKMDISTPVLIEQIQKGLENKTEKTIAQLSRILNEVDEWVAKHGKELHQLQADLHRLITDYQKHGELPVENENQLQVVLSKLREIPDFGEFVNDYREVFENLYPGLLSPGKVNNTYLESPQALIIVDDWLKEWSKTNVDKVQGFAQLHRILRPLVVYYKEHQKLPDKYIETIETFLQKLQTTPEIDKSTRLLITKILNVEEPPVKSAKECTPHDIHMVALEKRLRYLEKEKVTDCRKYEKLLLILKPMIDQYKKLGTECE